MSDSPITSSELAKVVFDLQEVDSDKSWDTLDPAHQKLLVGIVESSEEYRVQLGEPPLPPKEDFIEIPEELRILTDNFSMSFKKMKPSALKFKTSF